MSIQLPNAEDDYYWNLTLKDGRVIPVPPKAVSVIKRKMTNREPIHSKHETIPFSEIKGFERSSRRFTDVKLLEEAAQAFKEPVVTEDGVKARWVKKQVTQSEYDKYYAKSIMYRMVGQTEGMVMVAVLLPIHMINPQIHIDCTPEEAKKLG